MRQNIAGQVVGAQMITAADGTAFTGAVTVAVTGDGGAQATGSVGAGACTHEGNGFHTYAPAQAETNYSHVAFTFTGSGAIPVTVQVYTAFPQTGDSFARLGAPAGASQAADIAAVKVDTAAILVDTGTTLDGRIPAALVGGRMDASVGAMAANVMTAAATAADLTTELQSGLATAANLATVAGYLDTEIAAILAAVDTEIAALITAVDALPTNAELATALAAADDAVLAAIASLNNLSAAEVNAEVVDALSVDTYAESGPPAATASLAAKIRWLTTLARNEIRQTSAAQTVRNDANNADLATANVSDDGTTFTRGEFS